MAGRARDASGVDSREERLPVALGLLGAHAGDAEELLARARPLGAHVHQRRVGEDEVRRHALLARELAAQLVINPNTIQRAYRELEHEGYIVSIPGKGSFARAQSGVESGRAKELLAIFDDAAEELLYLGVTPGELKARIDGKGAGGDEN